MTSLYIHIPFCEKKCFYCSFVVSIGQEHRFDDYLQALRKEARFYQGAVIQTISIGGGTPSYLDGSQLMQIGQLIKDHFRVGPDCEFTIEANPESVDDAKARVFQQIGVNRVSLGIQTFEDRYLRFLGRNHDRARAIEAYGILRNAGFENINLDFMYSFPQQTLPEIKEDIEAMADLGSEHLSLYALMVEENSRFFARHLKPPDSHRQAQHYRRVVHLLKKAGLEQYEISNFARKGKRCLHNLNYWQGGDYIGLGIGAHSHCEGRRYWNTSRLQNYFSCLNNDQRPVQKEEILTSEERLLETFLIGLRMNQGVNLAQLEGRFHLKFPADKEVTLKAFLKDGFLKKAGPFFKASLKGRLVLDELCARLI